MNDQTIDLDAVESRIASIDQAGSSLRDEVSRLHSHVTEATDRDLRFLHRQIYGMKKALFFPSLDVDESAFNGQFSKHAVWNELGPKLAGRFGVETGTFLGGTTALLSRYFERVVTLEINAGFQERAKRNVGDVANVEFVLADSATYLRDHIDSWAAAGPVPDFFYLDAHWETVCPLPEEVELISRACPEAIIMIDDMEVPGDKGYGFDRYETAVLDQAYLAPVVEKFGLTCFVPRLASAKDCMSQFLVEPRGTWFVAQTAASIAILDACSTLRRI